MKEITIVLSLLAIHFGNAQITQCKDVYVERLSVEQESADSIYFKIETERTWKRFDLWQLLTSKGDTIWVKGKLSNSNNYKTTLHFQLPMNQYRQLKGDQITHLIDCPRNLALKIVNKKKIKLKKEVDQPLEDEVIMYSYGSYGKNFFNNADSTLQFLKVNYSRINEERDLPVIGFKLENGTLIKLDKVGRDFISKQTFRYKGSSRNSSPDQFILHITDDIRDELRKKPIKQILIYRNGKLSRKIEVINKLILE